MFVWSLQREPHPFASANTSNSTAGSSIEALNKDGAAGSPWGIDLVLGSGFENKSISKVESSLQSDLSHPSSCNNIGNSMCLASPNDHRVSTAVISLSSISVQHVKGWTLELVGELHQTP